MMKRPPVRLLDIGTYIPPRRMSNIEMLEGFHLDSEFLQKKIGVLARSVKEPGETTSGLCRKAFDDLQQRTHVDVAAVQLACVVTQNPDCKIPHTAAILHQELGLGKQCLTFDISQGCAGYTHGITIAVALMEKLGLGDALLFTCDPYSTIVDEKDKGTALIFGDAASVSLFSTDGSRAGYALVDSDFGTVPGSWECLVCKDGPFRMDGRQVFSNAAREVPQSIRRLLERNQLAEGDIDLFLLHPGSKYIVDFLRRALEAEPSKVPFEIAGYGNTVSSSIPIMLKDRIAQNGGVSRIVLSGFGVGFSWGSCLIEFQTSKES